MNFCDHIGWKSLPTLKYRRIVGDNDRGVLDPEIDRVWLNDRSRAIFDRLDRSTRLSSTLSTRLDSSQQ